MTENIYGTPFSEYREEQAKDNIFEYFVTPSFFNQFTDTKPLLIYGSRGTGKTTLFKALTISETDNVEEYLKSQKYIGVYYRIDLNIMSSFYGANISDEKWKKLFSYYFVSAINFELIRQLLNIKNILEFNDEKNFSNKYSLLFSGNDNANSLEELSDIIYNELYLIRDYINNCADQEFPHIGDFANIVKEFPQDLLGLVKNYDFSNKTIFYLIDEFEGLKDWQQQVVLSFVKYSNNNYTFKICMRPDGLKTAETIGGEYISETDDIKSIDLNKILNEKNEYYKYALDVCTKRMDLFCKKHDINNSKLGKFDQLFEQITFDNELQYLLDGKSEEIENDIKEFLNEIDYSRKETIEYFKENYFDFLIFRIIVLKKYPKSTIDDIWTSVINRDKSFNTYKQNYRYALLYQLYLKFSKNKIYCGFKELVNISGGTIRYLLEMCNEIFETAVESGEFSYNNPKAISYKIQTDAIYEISQKRVKQISAIPQIGLNIRTFIISLGKICQMYYRDEKISKIEPNHFSIKANNGKIDENVEIFLKECVMRGVLIKEKNNKAKDIDCIGADEYLYVIHPIYTPNLRISWRRKQKIEFDVKEINILISNNTSEITRLIKKYESKTKTNNEDSELEYGQYRLYLTEED